MISFVKKYSLLVKKYLLVGLALATALLYACLQIVKGKRAEDKANLAEAVTKQTEKSDQVLIDGLQNEQSKKEDVKKADTDTIVDYFS